MADERQAPIRLAFFGDSLSQGWGVAPGRAFPDVLGRMLAEKGRSVSILNHGTAGDTARDGLGRIHEVLGDEPEAVVVEFGANDCLSGRDPRAVETDLEAVLERLRASGAGLLVAGMRSLPGMDPEYARAFDPIFPRLAERFGAGLYPFILEGVFGLPGMAQRDGLHPNAAGMAEIARRMLPDVEKLLDELARPARSRVSSSFQTKDPLA